MRPTSGLWFINTNVLAIEVRSCCCAWSDEAARSPRPGSSLPEDGLGPVGPLPHRICVIAPAATAACSRCFSRLKTYLRSARSPIRLARASSGRRPTQCPIENGLSCLRTSPVSALRRSSRPGDGSSTRPIPTSSLPSNTWVSRRCEAGSPSSRAPWWSPRTPRFKGVRQSTGRVDHHRRRDARRASSLAGLLRRGRPPRDRL